MDGSEIAVVLSHDCDLCQGPEKEPWVELLIVRTVSGPASGDRTRMKNPRVLEFSARLNGDEIVAQAFAADRTLVPKDRLVGRTPAGFLDTVPVGLLASWISRRYIREAFADAFNARWSREKKSIREHLASTGEYLDAIYVSVDDQELPTDTDYAVIMRGTMLSDDYAEPSKRELAQEALDGTAARLAGCAGIDVVEVLLLSESELSLDDIRLLKRWDAFDDISISDGDQET